MTSITEQTARRVDEALTRFALADPDGNSEAKVAERILMPRSTLQRRRRGEGDFTVTQLYRIAALLAVPVLSLMPDDPQQPPGGTPAA